MKRKIAAILAADVAGYSRLVAEDEEETLRRLAAYRGVFDELVTRAGGRIFNTAGDSVLAEFPSAVEALRCAIDIQESLRTRNLAYPASRQMSFRIGLTIGDVVESGSDLLGDGVNIAARLQTLARPGGICLSQSMHDAVSNKLSVRFGDLGLHQVKNIPNPVRVFSVVLDEARVPDASAHGAASSPGESLAGLKRHFPLVAGLVGATVIGAGIAAFVIPKEKPVSREAAVESRPAGTSGIAAETKTESSATDTHAQQQSGEPSRQQSEPAKQSPPPQADAVPQQPITPELPQSTDVAAVPPAREDDPAALSRLRPIRWGKCTGDDATAAISACEALVADPAMTGEELARAHQGLGYAMRKTGDLDRAIASFTKSIEIVATAVALNERGTAYLLKGQLDSALADYDRAIQLDARNGEAFNNRAWLYLKTGRVHEALTDADKAIGLIPEKAFVWDTRGNIFEALGNVRSAISDYEKAIALDPGLQSSKSALARLAGR